MKIYTDINLKPYNTFGLEAKARKWCEFENVDELTTIINHCNTNGLEWYVLSGGSNIILTDTFEGMYIHPSGKNIELHKSSTSETDRTLIIADAGVVWDDLVGFCANNQLWGIECLSMIPGLVGASPVQNIGAYGAEAADHIMWVEYLDTHDMAIKTIKGEECEFGYRTSIFKTKLKGQAIVTRVAFWLNNQEPKCLNLNYGLLAQTVEQKGGATIQNIRNSVIEIRTAKLPDPSITGNAGSFFKNPVISTNLAESLKETYPEMPYYVNSDTNLVKIPAGWLIEKAGWKGYMDSSHGVGVHSQQALVIVNHGSGTTKDILNLADKITTDIESKFGIKLEMEVNIL